MIEYAIIHKFVYTTHTALARVTTTVLVVETPLQASSMAGSGFKTVSANYI